MSGYETCAVCGEYFREALVKRYGRRICQNCSSRNKRLGACPLCKRTGVPMQFHHVAGREYSPVMLAVCLNCHAVLTFWQNRDRKNWKDKGYTAEEIAMRAVVIWPDDPLRLYRKRFGKNPDEKWSYHVDRRCSVRNQV